ncbi:hypothetical protein SR870_17870 [Rhodopseudomonas palustris]|uniref:alpha/beta hydrolase family protein n=1 Tax=Rhodopseudomonas palustris TaxID=1076 RepID=UPI002ACE9775|nr:hypothetical protein [Rhodopseudomonas palustris]WQG98549.1 hypothetical protein SR870_17870 [Rhodopseudomonas palustris]
MLGGFLDTFELRGSPGAQSTRRYLRSFDPPGRAVTIPWRDEADLRGYYLPAGGSDTKAAPAVVCIGETHSKDTLLAVMAAPARARGLALLCVDLSLAGAAPAPRGSVRLESCVSAIIDDLAERPGIDPTRIAVVADGSPSSLVARGVAMDGRVAAAVCDGGLWELWADAHGASSGCCAALPPMPIAAMIRCPTLVALRRDGGIDPAHARRLLAGRPGSHRSDFVVADCAGADAEMAPETILGWVGRRLSRQRGRPAAISID